MNYVSTEALLKKQRQHQTQDKIDKSKTKISMVTDNILENETAINVFMMHLASEYSMEILLSSIEFTQFQEYILSHIPDIDDSTLETIKLIKFPSSIPKSSIVYDVFLTGVAIVYNSDPTENAIVDQNNTKNTEDSFLHESKMRAHRLYKKYIEIGSEYEINLRGDLRDAISVKLSDPELMTTNNLTLIDLLLIFEDCKVEMHQLQLWSLVRNLQN